MLFDYLLKEYGENEPIIIAELKVDGMSAGCIRQQIKKLTDKVIKKNICKMKESVVGILVEFHLLTSLVLHRRSQ